MLLRPLLALALMAWLPSDSDGKKDGRKGNAHYEAEQYAAATSAYKAGLAQYEDAAPGPIRSGLLNNLGATYFRQEDYEKAQQAFRDAIALADAPPRVARAAYNAGNTAAAAEDLEASLDFYRQALLNDPTSADAKFNYEFVKRQLENQEDNQQQQQQDQQQNQDQQQDQEQQQDQQQQDQQQQDQQQQEQQQQDQQQQEQQQQDQQQQREQQISREQAEQILQALENEEEQLLREVQKMNTRPRRVEKDW